MTEQVEHQEEGQPSPAEERARRMGWLPQDEFRGDPNRWVPAENYVERAEQELPILKGTLKTMERKMQQQETLIKQQSEKMAAVHSDMQEFVKFTKGAEERAYQKALKELKAEQLAAVEAGDTEAFKVVSASLDDLINQHPVMTGKAPEAPAAAATAPVTGPGRMPLPPWYEPAVFDQWKADNAEWLKKPKMAIYARQMDAFLSDTLPMDTDHQERLDKIKELVEEEFPDFFNPENPARKKPAAVAGGGGAAPAASQKGRTYADLPSEARQACDRFAGKDGKGKDGSIPGYTREQYLTDYDWS